MTREQAIEVLKNRYYSGVTRSRPDDEWRLATDTAIAALRGSRPDTGCPECSWIDPALIADEDLNYCKNCGRRLRDALIEGTEGANE